MSKISLNTKGDFFQGLVNKVNNIGEKWNFNFQNIDINLIKPSKKNFFEIREVETLAEDIKANGLYHNLVVRKLENGTYEIISGERRYHALKSLGINRIPCQIREDDDIDSEIMLIQANANTRELTEGEKLKMVERLRELYNQKKKSGEKIKGKIRDKIGEDLGGISGMQVQRYIKISGSLIPELRELLENQKITLIESLDFSKLSEENQMYIYKFIIENENIPKQEMKKLKADILKQYQEEESIQRNREFSKSISKLEIEDQKDEEIKSINLNTEGLLNDKVGINTNMELEITLKNFETAIKNIIKLSKNIDNISDENKKKIKQLKDYIKYISEIINNI